MVDEAQTTNPTQAGSSPTTGSALQPLAQTGLQPQSTNSLQTPAASNLQPTSNQTINSINQLDQGSSSIKLSGISATSTTVAQTTTPAPVNHKSVMLYGGVGIIVAGIMAFMVYRLLRAE
jgi:predicted extracellular nuclease